MWKFMATWLVSLLVSYKIWGILKLNQINNKKIEVFAGTILQYHRLKIIKSISVSGACTCCIIVQKLMKNSYYNDAWVY